MSLLAVQRLLARLYTDSAFRARFFEDPDEACREMGLTEVERRQVAALDCRQVERFAQSLRQKRLGLVRELLPGTARVLGERFGERFFQYCDRQPSALDRLEEAKAFLEYLCGAIADTDVPDYLRDLLACERLRLEVLYPTGSEAEPHGAAGPEGSLEIHPGTFPYLTPHARVAAVRYDMEALYPRLLRGEAVEARPEPCFILIGKLRGATRVRLKRINAATARLLVLCNGTRPLAAIVDEVAAELHLNAGDRHRFAAECARFLAPLVRGELIRLSRAEEGEGSE